MKKTRSLNIRFDTETYELLQTISKKYGITMSDLIRDCIDDKIDLLREFKVQDITVQDDF